MANPGTARPLVTYSLGVTGATDGHEAATRKGIAQRLARLMGGTYEGEFDPQHTYAAPPYLVPSDTLSTSIATQLGVRNLHDLFGGVVPYPFVATKTITHPLIDDRARA